MKGYKAFKRIAGSDKLGMCRGMLYEEGKVYEIEGELKICKNGLHFCEHLVQTFEYYEHDHDRTIYAEVEALGDIDVEDNLKFKLATNKLKIVKFLSSAEVDSFFKDTNYNTGDYNTGDYNTGDYNTGYRNTGYRNTGNYNTGNYNTGYRNTGYRNTGYYNTGNYNTGYFNTGDYNTGYFNRNTPETIRVFEKDCLRRDWELAKKPQFLYFRLIDGKTYQESFIESFKNCSKRDVTYLINLPNFDYQIFEDISGITKEMIEEKLGE